MPVMIRTSCLLVCSNLFMTFAWYGHLKNLNESKWYIAALVSWGIALFEYLLQVPANRIGYTELSLSQLKIIQEIITLSVFVPFAVFIYAPTVEIGLSVGGFVSSGSSVFYIPLVRIFIA